MPKKVDELLYSNAVKWIQENFRDKSIPDQIKQDFLHFNTLLPEEKAKLLITLKKLLETIGLPQEIEKSLPWLMFDLKGLPGELFFKIGSHLNNDSDISNLASTSKEMYAFFQPTRLLNKFLQRVAYGEQDEAERLFTSIYDGDEEKIQDALLYRGGFTDYSGRTFHCSAYEYAYWAKDTRMCRMLSCYMDDKTKAQMLKRVVAIDASGLSYKQGGAEHRSVHFDLTALKTALQVYVDGFDAWQDNNWDAMEAAWMAVGKAQRDVPAHLAQEYCNPDRSFYPLSSFNVDRYDIPSETLPRVLTFYDTEHQRHALWFPLKYPSSNLGFHFALIRSDMGGAVATRRGGDARLDLAAISQLDDVRTADLVVSREHLNPPAVTQGMMNV